LLYYLLNVLTYYVVKSTHHF